MELLWTVPNTCTGIPQKLESEGDNTTFRLGGGYRTTVFSPRSVVAVS